ncbi:MAG TPA: hypothetical protein VF522_03995 [Ramlibacter sp.]|uniref:hypothetical protein n=1 Tax=Ramlibacter sp. TaxID=1917967 RepID=UPI002ED2FECA
MQLTIKLSSGELALARADLAVPHAFAFERVGFLLARPSWMTPDAIDLVVTTYLRVDDEDYVPDESVGASIGSSAMRKALQEAYKAKASLLHVHVHSGRGRPRFSGVDLASSKTFVPGFFNVLPDLPHGVLVLSDDSAAGLVWTAQRGRPHPVTSFVQPSGPYRVYGQQHG